MFKKLGFAVLALALIAFPLAGCGGGDDDVIRIGVYEPMTGVNAAGGEMTVEGIELANELFPEILGKQIEIIVVDNKSEPQEAANAVSRLIDRDNVHAIIGSYGSSLSMAGGPVAEEAGIPVVGCSPTNPLVTLGNDYYFRVCFIDPFQGTVMANYAVNELGAKTAAIIKDVTQDYSVGLSNFFKQAFVELTGDADSIVAEINYNTGDQDFTPQLQTAKAANPDVIFAPGNYAESALLIKQAREADITVPILGGDTWEAPDFLDVGGDAVEGVVYSTHFTAQAPVTARSNEFLDAYRNKFGAEANAFAALGYDAYLVILDAIERANSHDPGDIRDALADTQIFEGATGIITLDENGDATKSAIINTVENGEFVYLTTVHP
ncbi:MAG: ABC transporter substrate-binding protein [Firmicutes bacterium]|nr:ABC transporter substrate-binding protein [Bacillota bacterium]